VRARIEGVDLLTLEAHARLLKRLDDAPAAASPPGDSADDDEDSAGAPLALAIDLNDTPAEEAADGERPAVRQSEEGAGAQREQAGL
jgi:exoribonuclease-2